MSRALHYGKYNTLGGRDSVDVRRGIPVENLCSDGSNLVAKHGDKSCNEIETLIFPRGDDGMTVNERTKGYNASLRAIQKSGRRGYATRKASSAEIRDKTIRRETGFIYIYIPFRYYYSAELYFFNILLFTPQNT